MADQPSILIVDDDPDQTDILAHSLGKQGYATATASTGEDGLSMARNEHPDLVLMDIRLPDMDGLTICRQLNDDPSTCEIPVIILSAMERPDIIRRSRSAGCQYYLRKPYDPNALLLLVESALHESHDW